MAHYLDRLFSHPLLLWGLVLAGMYFLWKLIGGQSLESRLGGLWRFLAAAVILAYLATIAWYGYGPRFADHTEPLTVCVSWAYFHGQPIYHSANAAERYTLVYGPLAYLIEGMWMRLLGPNLDWVKMPGVIASALSVLLVAMIARRGSRPGHTLVLTALYCMALMQFGFASAFWTRTDPFILLAVAVGALAVEFLPPGIGMILLGVTLGAGPLLKAFSFLYFLPLAPIAFRRFGLLRTVAAGAISLAVFAAPFLLLPRISFANHLYWLSMTTRNGYNWPMLRFAFENAAFLLIPLIVYAKSVKLDIRPLEWLCLGVAFAGTVILASKWGASWYYEMPLVPILVMLATRPARQPALASFYPAAIGLGLALALLAIYSGITLEKTLAEQGDVRAEEGELMTIIKEHPGAKIAMGTEGYVPEDPITERAYLRPLLLFAGSPLGVDPTGMVDIAHEQLPDPPETLAGFDRGEFGYWIFPAGEKPFVNFPFSPALRGRFLANYSLLKSGQYFDVWAYKREKSGGTTGSQ